SARSSAMAARAVTACAASAACRCDRSPRPSSSCSRARCRPTPCRACSGRRRDRHEGAIRPVLAPRRLRAGPRDFGDDGSAQDHRLLERRGRVGPEPGLRDDRRRRGSLRVRAMGAASEEARLGAGLLSGHKDHDRRAARHGCRDLRARVGRGGLLPGTRGRGGIRRVRPGAALSRVDAGRHRGLSLDRRAVSPAWVVATGALELTGAHGHCITQARSLVMHSFTGLILVALTTAGCSATYAYVPATNAPLTTLYGHAASDYAIPPQAPRGDLRVASYGIEPLSPEGADDESVGALHIRLSIANKSDQPWTLDTREQQAALEGRATSTPAFAARSPGVGSPPIVTIAPNSTRLVDVFFPLPEDMQSASAVPALRFTSTVHTDAGPVSETTPFDRIETDGDSAVAADDSAPQAEYDPEV